ncbi:alpha/beta fold hydrolase [Dyadobacter sp. Leaf189]|uniref:alpha/beta fold hydrolase n=1 Tax=Dyadobacter sp. Leaf189 TaxID=1736295 RepID=UPI0006FDF2EC|nr:alpha/beta fold hydrolase [Dyadobacter sp. Leaf189]KQS27800.1 hypothetical protein ASG33_15380 [Dyadobacter sp. Leaf189]
MNREIVFFHGGGSKEDYEADQKLVDSLVTKLGPGTAVHYPYLPNDGTPDLGRRRQIGQEIAKIGDGVILAAHSLGASMLLAYLSENTGEKSISGIFLLATPFWDGDEDWVEPFKLLPDFAARLDTQVPLFFYHCRDDEEVPLAQFDIYKQQLPWATFRQLETGGHQFLHGLGVVAADIRALQSR